MVWDRLLRLLRSILSQSQAHNSMPLVFNKISHISRLASEKNENQTTLIAPRASDIKPAAAVAGVYKKRFIRKLSSSAY
jgi:hypothetical protein